MMVGGTITADLRSAQASVAGSWRGVAERYWPAIMILVVALAYRGVTFGNPTLDYDEQLYLVVGDRIWRGELPYVDNWDRKPLGLFLFYAAVRALGGQGIVQYQVVAAICAGGTACLIWAMARRVTDRFGAIAMALAYLFILNPLHGAGGQSSVLYNLLTAGAAYLAFRANDTDEARRVVPMALAAMALMGVAIQFKYTPVVEGAFLGCWFLWRFHRVGMTRARIAATASAMVALALLPTVGAVGFYWSIGQLDAFVQANFVSVFQRNPFPPETRALQRQVIGVAAGPLLAVVPAAAVTWWRMRGSLAPGDATLMIGWCVAALIGFGMLGDVYDFYFITAALPLLTLTAAVVRRGGLGVATGLLLVLWPVLLSPPIPGSAQRRQRAMDELASVIKPHVGDRCLYVHDGPTILYLLTGACSPTRIIYPDHLTNPTEAPALGVNALQETKRLLATRPGAIVTADRPVIPRVSRDTAREVQAALARDYRLAAQAQGDRVYSAYVLRPEAGGLRR